MKDKIIGSKRFIRYKKMIIFIMTFMIVYFISITSFITKKYSLAEGDIARINIKANKEVIDKTATEARSKQAEEEVVLQFNQKPEVKKQAVDSVKVLFNKVITLKDGGKSDKEIVDLLKVEAPIVLDEDDYLNLSKFSKEELKSLQSSILETLSEVYDGRIEENKPEDIKKAQEFAVGKFNSLKYSKSLRDMGITIVSSQIKPNFFYDKEKTEEMKKQAVKNAPPVVIKKNQIVVKEGEPITENQIEILKDLGILNTSAFEWHIYLTLGVMVFLILFIQWYYLYRYYRELYEDSGKLMMISIINIISIVLARTISIASPFLIPLALAPMLIALLINYKISITISIINCVLIAASVGFNVEVVLLAIVNSVLGATLLRKMQQRNDIVYSSLYIGTISMILTFCVGVLLSNNIIEILKKTGFVGISSLVSAILTIGFLPLFESTFDIVTTVKLLELSNPNNPLLKKLLMEAPGTYHHSILVANLAEMAAEEIGGNPVLARIAAYYHDIGKTKRPYFFKENQIGKENPHDKITANLSTLIITSHVKDGVEMAKEYNIPKVIQDIIEQHHGNTLVKYFYVTAKNTSEKPEDIKEEDFRYPGPIPQSKEAGIIMLADSVEASVRSISDPTKGKIEEMVNNIIKGKLNDGQLNDCDITLRDLEKIRKSFLKALNGIYHQRIEYPTDNTKVKQGEKL